jgi:plastocyanin
MIRSFFSVSLLVAVALPMVAADHEIVQSDRTFSKQEITIKAGDQIIFKNADEVTHNVYSATPGMSFDLKRQAPGASSTVPFLKEGTAEVQCSIHPKMKLIVHVTK